MTDSNRPKIMEIMNLNRFFHFYLLKMDILLTIDIIDLKLTVWILKVPFERKILKFWIWALVFILWHKTRNILSFLFAVQFSTFHKM